MTYQKGGSLLWQHTYFILSKNREKGSATVYKTVEVHSSSKFIALNSLLSMGKTGHPVGESLAGADPKGAYSVPRKATI